MTRNVILIFVMFIVMTDGSSSSSHHLERRPKIVQSHSHSSLSFTQNEDSIAGPLFFNSLDEWISRINQTIQRDHISINQTCYDHLSILFSSAKNRQPWALRIFDSFGKPGAGIMEASLSFLGFYSECVESHAPIESEQQNSLEPEDPIIIGSSQSNDRKSLFSGKYCMANMHLPNAALSVLQKFAGLSTTSINSPLQPKIGICLPSSCSHNEIQRIASDALSLFIANATLTVTTCSGPSKNITNDFAATFVIGVFVTFFVIVIIGTIVDYSKNYSDYSNECGSSLVVDVRRQQLMAANHHHHHHHRKIVTMVEPSSKTKSKSFDDYFIAFSIIENCKNVLSTSSISNKKSSSSVGSNGSTKSSNNSGSIDVLNGLRVIMMVWIVVLHSYSFAMQWIFFRNPKQLQSAPKSILSQIFANGTFSVDSFFFISGLLVTISCMKQMKATNGRLNLITFYFHRYVRMTPLMMFIIAFSSNLLKYFNELPSFEESTVMFDSWCRQNWWLNSLYLHNFIHRENMCLSHTWYSAVDIQLYFFSPIVLIPLYRRPKIGFAIMAIAMSSSIGYTAFVTITRHLPAVPYLIDIVSQEAITDYFASIYIKPYARVGPYLVGMIFGYILSTRGTKNISLTKRQAMIGWTISTIANFAILFAMVPVYAGYQLSDVLAGIYSSTSRIIWALTLGWITYSTIAGRGGIVGSILSAKFWLPWSRLTYAGYLIHPIIMAVFYGSQQATFEFSHFLMIYIVLGNLILTYAISFFLSVIFESPFVTLEGLINSKTMNQTVESPEQ